MELENLLPEPEGYCTWLFVADEEVIVLFLLVFGEGDTTPPGTIDPPAFPLSEALDCEDGLNLFMELSKCDNVIYEINNN